MVERFVPRQLFAAVMGSLVLGGCANHPLVDDVTGYSTHAIVQKLRCEAQQAVLTQLEARWLTSDQANVFELIRKRKAYELWRANHNEILTEIDAGIAAVVAEIKAVIQTRDEAKSTFEAKKLEAAAIAKIIDQSGDEETKSKSPARTALRT